MSFNAMNAKPAPAAAEAAALDDQALAELQRGRPREALLLWRRVLAIEPRHLRALNMLGQLSFQQGDFATARQAFETITVADGSDPRQWVNLSFACQRLGDEAAEEAALFKALSVDASDLLALLQRGRLYERQGRRAEAAGAYGAAAVVAPPAERLTPELRPLLLHALQFRDAHERARDDFVRQHLAAAFQDCAGADLERFQLSLDILLGRKRRVESRPSHYFFPQLQPVEFFDRALFPWLDAFEAATDTLRDEFLQVLATEDGFTPYITYSSDQPLNQWAELNNSPRWSALHLVKDGQVVAENASRCPRTMALWSAQVPAPEQPGRTPVAMFSLLQPRTHIPAHTGASNVRLLAHVPLIVPAGCRFRVGNTTREWVPGQAWAFDDTVEHEAWNDSDKLRVILIFDHWHPALTADERRMITALGQALDAFSGSAAAGYGA